MAFRACIQVFFFGAQFWVAACCCAGEAYLPDSDGEVLTTLPKVLLAESDNLALLRDRLAENPSDEEAARRLATGYLALGKWTAEPRYYGYARAALSPWWDTTATPDLLLLRAKLKERDHEYDDAVADLRMALDARPKDAQAWIELANIYRVLGDYEHSMEACDSLDAALGRSPNISTLFRAPILAATGRAGEGYAMIDTLIPLIQEQLPEMAPWALTVQAEIALVLGQEDRAEAHYLEAIREAPHDFYLKRAYADLLLDQQRDQESLRLLQGDEADTGVLVRLAIAAQRTSDDGLAAACLERLLNRFEEFRLRGGRPHGRYEARCALELQNDPQRALSIALENWYRQKERQDTRLVLEAAIASGEPAAAQSVLDFLELSNNQDVLLRRLADQLGGKP